MDIRQEIVDAIIADLEADGSFKRIYKNITPTWTQIKRFPAASVVYAEEIKDPDNITSNSCYYVGTVSIFVFNKQAKDKFEDILSDLITTIYKVITENDFLCTKVISADVSEMKRDGGIIHPYSVAEIRLEVRYKLAL